MTNTTGIVDVVLTVITTLFVLCSAIGTTTSDPSSMKNTCWMKDKPAYYGAVISCSYDAGFFFKDDCTWWSDIDGIPDSVQRSGGWVAFAMWLSLLLVAAVKIPLAASVLCANGGCCKCGCPGSLVMAIILAVLLMLAIAVYDQGVYRNEDTFDSKPDYGPGFGLAVTSFVLMLIDVPLAYLSFAHAKAMAATQAGAGMQMTNVAHPTVVVAQPAVAVAQPAVAVAVAK